MDTMANFLLHCGHQEAQSQIYGLSLMHGIGTRERWAHHSCTSLHDIVLFSYLYFSSGHFFILFYFMFLPWYVYPKATSNPFFFKPSGDMSVRIKQLKVHRALGNLKDDP